MSTEHEPEGSAITKLEKVVEDLGKRHVWTNEEVEAITGMIKMWRGFIALGFFFGATKQILIWIAIFAAFVVSLRAGLLEWLNLAPPK